MASGAKSRSTQDSFVDDLHSEIISGSKNLAAWVKHIHAEKRIESLFGLETWLKGLRSFFDIEHLPLSEVERAGLVTRSFAQEIQVVCSALQVCETYACELYMLGGADKPGLEEYIEAQVHKDNVLTYHLGRIMEQLTPLESISQLLDSLNDLRVLIDALRNPERQDYQVFLSLGRCFRRDLRNCRYIDMLMGQRLRLHYDRVYNASLSGALRRIGEEQVRRHVAVSLLYLFRFLKYLRLVSLDLNRDRPLKHYVVIFSLLHQEMGRLSEFIRARFRKAREAGRDLRNASEQIAYSLKVESQRVMDRELAFVPPEKEAALVYVRIENSYGLLRNCCQSSIVTLAQAIDRSFDGAILFPSREGSLIAAQKLRQDLWDLRQYLQNMLNHNEELDSNKIIGRLISFKEASLRSLMYGDWMEFENLSDSLISSCSLMEARARLRKFVDFLETLDHEVSKRSIFQERSAESFPEFSHL